MMKSSESIHVTSTLKEYALVQEELQLSVCQEPSKGFQFS